MKKKIKFGELELSSRVMSVLRNAQISSVDELCDLHLYELMRYRNLGWKSAIEIMDELEKVGRTLNGGNQKPKPTPPLDRHLIFESVLRNIRHYGVVMPNFERALESARRQTRISQCKHDKIKIWEMLRNEASSSITTLKQCLNDVAMYQELAQKEIRGLSQDSSDPNQSKAA